MSYTRVLTFVLFSCVTTAAIAADEKTPGEAYTFERHIRPIFKEHCFICHGEQKKPEANLDLRLRLVIAIVMLS